MLHPTSDPQNTAASPLLLSSAGKTDGRLLLICVLLVTVSVLATVPVLEMGVNDDWSYTWTARELAQTGHLTYNGWATAMLGVQAYWAALWIKLFGFSFTLVRLTTLPLAAGCAALLYALGRRVGLAPGLAAFGSLTVTLSPVFTPLAASFMSDVPGLFFLLLCLYAADRAAQDADAGHASRAAAWLTLLAASGLLGGTVRQVDWIAPMAFLPYLAWVKRADKRFLIVSSVLWLITLVGALWCMHWFKQQPYAIVERPTEGMKSFLRGLPWSLSPLWPLGLTTLLLVLPALIGALPAWRPLARSRPVLFWSLLVLAVAVPYALWHGGTFLAPWMGNIITTWGVIGQWSTDFGDQPVTLPKLARIVLSVAVYGMVGVLLVAAIKRGLDWSRDRQWRVTPMALIMRLWLLYSLCYVPLLALRMSLPVGAFDRYLIFILPLPVFLVLNYYQSHVGDRMTGAGYLVLALFALYGVATTHDYLAMGRARLAAATELTDAGVPRTEILAGLEYDGWTQIEQTGYFNDARIGNPPGAYHPASHPQWPLAGHAYFTDKVPSIHYRYFVVLSPQTQLAATPYPAVEYTAWLPPFRRQALIQEVR